MSHNTTEMKNRTVGNFHWWPVYLTCAPCNVDYSVVMKMETFSRDSLYIKHRLGLDIDVQFVSNGGTQGYDGDITTDR